jgi:ferritin-like metal-binding protein YciE
MSCALHGSVYQLLIQSASRQRISSASASAIACSCTFSRPRSPYFRSTCKGPPGIDGLISEADEVAGEVADKDVLDAAIIGSAQAVEHYEIARYGTLIAWAESLGHDDIIRLLNTNLNEEKAADKKLALRKGVNRKAAS